MCRNLYSTFFSCGPYFTSNGSRVAVIHQPCTIQITLSLMCAESMCATMPHNVVGDYGCRAGAKPPDAIGCMPNAFSLLNYAPASVPSTLQCSSSALHNSASSLSTSSFFNPRSRRRKSSGGIQMGRDRHPPICCVRWQIQLVSWMGLYGCVLLHLSDLYITLVVVVVLLLVVVVFAYLASSLPQGP